MLNTCVGNMVRKLVTMKVSEEDYDRYRAWTGILGLPMSDGLGRLMDECGIPSIEELRAFVSPKTSLARSPRDGSSGDE